MGSWDMFLGIEGGRKVSLGRRMGTRIGVLMRLIERNTLQVMVYAHSDMDR